jgi:hypothetical protein
VGVLPGIVIALAGVALAVFVGVAVHELNYAAAHPYRYGPAKVIATASGGGALVSLALGALGWHIARPLRRS